MADEEVKAEAEKEENTEPPTETTNVDEGGGEAAEVAEAVEAGAAVETDEAPADVQSQATEAQSEVVDTQSEAADGKSEYVSEAQSIQPSEAQSEAGDDKSELPDETQSQAEKPEQKKVEIAPDVEVSSSESGTEEEEFSPLGPVVSSLMGGSDEEEEEEEDSFFRSLVSETKLLTEPIDREAYIEEYKNLILEQAGIQRKNSFLSYKLSMYFKKKKIDDLFQEPEGIDDVQSKYEKKLDELFLMKDKAARDQRTELEDIKYMQESFVEQTHQREDEFKAMQKRERDIGKGLIDTRTGKVISEKQVERLIRRQNIKAEEISEVRLKYIKKKDTVKNLENQLRTLETIDGKLHLIEYEQLRMENHNLSDKIEERDEELRKLRIRYNGAVQTLAHMREKSYNADAHIDDLSIECGYVEEELSSTREFLNELKVQRDLNRADAIKIKNQSGLLTCSNLLIDMEKRWNELDKTRERLTSLKDANKSRRKNLEAIRKNIEYNTEKGLITVKPIKNVRKSLTGVYKGRPSLIEPKFNSKDGHSKLDLTLLDEEFQ